MAYETDVQLFEALANLSRFRIYGRVRAAGDVGMRAGAIAEALGREPSGLTRHLAILERSGLLRRIDEGRTSTFVADEAAYRRLAGVVASLADRS